MIGPGRGESASVVAGRAAGELDFDRMEHAVAFENPIDLAAAVRPPMVERRLARHRGAQLADFGNDERLEQRARHRVPAQRIRGGDPRQVAGQSGVAEVAFGLGRNPFDRIALVGGDLKPLEGRLEDGEPAFRRLHGVAGAPYPKRERALFKKMGVVPKPTTSLRSNFGEKRLKWDMQRPACGFREERKYPPDGCSASNGTVPGRSVSVLCQPRRPDGARP